MIAKDVLVRLNEPMLKASLLFMLLATLAATLWPFDPLHRNDVTWVGDGNGLRFGPYGMILSTAEFANEASHHSKSCSLELWLEPGTTKDSSIILDFYHAPTLTDFSLRQEDDSLYLLRDVPEDRAHLRKAAIWVDHAFVAGKSTHLVINSGPEGTSVFINGSQRAQISNFGLTSYSLSGRLIFGDSTLHNDTWSGVLRGLAIYVRELTPSEISEPYSQWTSGRRREDSATVALYQFDERTGSTIKNQALSPDLSIPVHYNLVQHSFLTVPWREFYPAKGYVKDVVVNVIGFMPLGFLLFAYLSLIRKSHHPILKTMILCALISFTIETLQAFLPTRTSGLTDVITNTTGGVLGAAFCEIKLIQAVFREIGFGRPSGEIEG